MDATSVIALFWGGCSFSRVNKLGFVKIKTDFNLCHSEGALATEESYSTDLLHAECFLSETGAVRSFASLRMTVKRGSFSVERRAGACPRPAMPTDL